MGNDFDRISGESAALEELRQEIRAMGRIEDFEEDVLSDLAQKIGELKASSVEGDRDSIWSQIETGLASRGTLEDPAQEPEGA